LSRLKRAEDYLRSTWPDCILLNLMKFPFGLEMSAGRIIDWLYYSSVYGLEIPPVPAAIGYFLGD